MDGEIITTKKISKISYSFFEEIFINQIVKKKNTYPNKFYVNFTLP